ncbi:hypothetical protein NEOLEDRAFT_1141006 [Neolentinus lepideus HHB14362 ss-1]|uniref:Secreted protein n=1 Tax=Neolentinus lepideus HHB14362 ss-1 TaxID=1314782 RepID=A0A165NYH5_9AGAM|nr:hypothetical protein NEOLEDRAFT_1141006 [Neolentinus lepideus HHB14362 ss-1]
MVSNSALGPAGILLACTAFLGGDSRLVCLVGSQQNNRRSKTLVQTVAALLCTSVTKA